MSRVIAPFAQFFDGNGDPLANGFLRFLETNTNNTLKNTYADSNQTLPNANPLQLDAEGRCPNVFGQGIYRIDSYTYNPVTGLPGELLQSFDPVLAEFTETGAAGGNFAAWDAEINYEISEIVIQNGLYYRSIQTPNIGHSPDTNPDYWEQITILRYWNTNVTYLTDDVVIYNSALYFSLADANQGNIPISSPTWWNPVGSGTVLLNWEESSTTLQPVFAGYDFGAVGNEVGTAYINELGVFPLTPSADPTNDYDVSNKQYVDASAAGRMNWTSDWVPGTYEINDVVRDDHWTMVAIAQTDDRPAPQPAGEAEWVRDEFSPPDFTTTSANETVLYIGQRYTFTPSFFVRTVRVWIPADAIGSHIKIWAIHDPDTAPRFVNVYPGTTIDSTRVEKWLELSIGVLLVEESTVIDLIMVIRAPSAEVTFTSEWKYNRVNGDPAAGDINHQSGGNANQIRVHEQDTSLVDQSLNLDNIGPGSTIHIDDQSYTWLVLEASKTGDVYTFIVDPAARAKEATSDFTFGYYGLTDIYYVYNTDLYSADTRIQGYFGNIYDPDNATYINENGYGIDIQIQNVISSDDWEVVAQPNVSTLSGSGINLGYWEESEEYFRPITDSIGYLGDSTHNIQGLFLSDNANIVTPTATDITLNSNILFHQGNLSTDDTLVGDSDTVAVAESAIKGYVDNHPGILTTWENSGNNLWPITTTVGNLGGTSNYVNSGYFSGTIRVGTSTPYSILANNGLTVTSGVAYYGTETANGMIFRINGATSWVLTSGNILYPNVANSYDIGTTSRELRHIYHGSGGRAYYGSGQQMYVRWDGASGIISCSSGVLFVRCTSGSGLSFGGNGSDNWFLEGSTGSLTPWANNTYDIGDAIRRVKTIYSVNALNVSDMRYKHQVKNNIFGLDFINRIKVYNFKLTEVNNDRFRCGVNAQEINGVLNQLGLGYDDFSGVHYDEKNDRWDIDYTNFISILIQAVQELSTKVDELGN